jgi:hypothetical protein
MHTIITLSGRKTSRRGVMGLAFGAVAAATLATANLAAADAAKKSQKSVDYQGHAKGGKSCNSCKAFQAPSKCKTVEGYVEPAGWCNVYEKK